MPETVQNSQNSIDTKVAYSTSWEHLSDELRRLGLLINILVLKRRKRQPPSPLDQFKGLVLSEEEISGLLSDTAYPSSKG